MEIFAEIGIFYLNLAHFPWNWYIFSKLGTYSLKLAHFPLLGIFSFKLADFPWTWQAHFSSNWQFFLNWQISPLVDYFNFADFSLNSENSRKLADFLTQSSYVDNPKGNQWDLIWCLKIMILNIRLGFRIFSNRSFVFVVVKDV